MNTLQDQKPRLLTRSATCAYPCLTLQTNPAPRRDRQVSSDLIIHHHLLISPSNNKQTPRTIRNLLNPTDKNPLSLTQKQQQLPRPPVTPFKQRPPHLSLYYPAIVPGSPSFTPRRAAPSVLSRRVIKRVLPLGGIPRLDTFLAREDAVHDSFVVR